MNIKYIWTLAIAILLTTSTNAGIVEGIMAFDTKQYGIALSEFTYLADEGNPVAIYYMGRLYNEGLGVQQDTTVAKRYFEAADQAHYTPATIQLGKIYLYGLSNTTADTNLGLYYLRKAAHVGDSIALYELGNAAILGVGMPMNYTHAFNFYLMSALRGDRQAQHQLGRLYLKGRGVPQDYERALSWMTRSARQGYTPAQVELAELRTNDKRLKDPAAAYMWYSILAAYNSDSIGLESAQKRDELEPKVKNPKILAERQHLASTWKAIAPEESVSAEMILSTPTPIIPGFNDTATLQAMITSEGILWQDGSPYGVTTAMLNQAVVDQNMTPITLAIEKATRLGRTDAYAYYGDLLRTRFDNSVEAMNWYKKGADAGNAYAQYQLAQMYCRGEALERSDIGRCYGWLLIAQDNKNPMLTAPIQISMTAAESKITPAEQEFARDMLLRHADITVNTNNESKSIGTGISFF